MKDISKISNHRSIPMGIVKSAVCRKLCQQDSLMNRHKDAVCIIEQQIEQILYCMELIPDFELDLELMEFITGIRSAQSNPANRHFTTEDSLAMIA